MNAHYAETSTLTHTPVMQSYFGLNKTQSDSLLVEAARLNPQKNKSNLYLIKSHSFCLESLQHQQKQQQKQQNQLKAQQHRQSTKKANKIAKELKKSKSSSSSVSGEKKMKQKCTHVNDVESSDYQILRRKPTIILENEVTQNRRPKSMPDARRVSFVGYSKTSTTAETITKNSAIKSESFIRHSLQSIRRSFRAQKKKKNVVTVAASTSPSLSSPAGSVSAASKAFAPAASSATTSNNCTCTCNNNSFPDTIEGAGDVLMLNGHATLIDVGATYRTSAIKVDPPSLALFQDEDFVGDPEDLKKDPIERSASSIVSTLGNAFPDASITPLQCFDGAQSLTCLSTLEPKQHPKNSIAAKTTLIPLQPAQLLQQCKRNCSQQLWTPECLESGDVCSLESCKNLLVLKQDDAFRRLANSESDSMILSSRSTLVTNFSPTRKTSTMVNPEQSSSTARLIVPEVCTEREKKRKEVSSSRVRKFHRHFSQLPKDEKLINYFSCALVSDILLQGHLYITEQNFAFYSNVFGYVTKVVIATASVTKISKEKTAKIIPNAVGVVTSDERHVFGSFISRAEAYGLMCSVCTHLVPVEIVAKVPADNEFSDEYTFEDDSSCSISGNESSQLNRGASSADNAVTFSLMADEANQTLKRSIGASSLNITDGMQTVVHEKQQRHSDIPLNAKLSAESSSLAVSYQQQQLQQTCVTGCTDNKDNKNSTRTAYLVREPYLDVEHSDFSQLTMSKAPSPAKLVNSRFKNIALIDHGTESSNSSSTSSTTSNFSSPNIEMVTHKTLKTSPQGIVGVISALFKKWLICIKFPTELHVVYLGAFFSLILAVLSAFLLYRILNLGTKTCLYRSPSAFIWSSDSDDDIFAKTSCLHRLKTKSTQEIQTILEKDLKQIIKVRRSLEMLATLIHNTNKVNYDNSAASAGTLKS